MTAFTNWQPSSRDRLLVMVKAFVTWWMVLPRGGNFLVVKQQQNVDRVVLSYEVSFLQSQCTLHRQRDGRSTGRKF